jgi:predicted SnoaL-like aldol condensation-catalyzing enzyme
MPKKSTPEENKRIVERIFDLLYNYSPERMVEFDELKAKDYIQHNPNAGQGLDGFKEYMNRLLPFPEEHSEKYIVAVNMIAEGDFVVRQEIKTYGMLVDIYRFEDGMAKEHWDAYRPNPGTERYDGF